MYFNLNSPYQTKHQSVIVTHISYLITMKEIFDIITAVNHLKDRVDDLEARIAYLCKYPSFAGFNDYVEEEIACKILHISSTELRKMRSSGEITFTRFHRKIMYPVSSLNQYLEKMTIK
jgi:hypothetical protein